ncbi:sulfotransferase family 2 domain-containing protein [Leptothoe spongobia]|uniref:Sulfotransferase family 2 domain-containing protein n=1 Tax=Leptothoe spongobia TAU-MAC 1115 TaxID=1967444 RepID=A0A947GLW9_9CYAN|nr:sulfotransferase family 2 domain-containing protein [Leptothoe spongobia]MBT9317292.1 sulfotransferase family 2 domain-containing protein [Leptothoe spongobia TAU-MAC 1115]
MSAIQLIEQMKKPLRTLRDIGCEARASQLAWRFCVGEDYQRIYHYHIRKTAGTSLNSAFWNLAGLDLKSIGRKLYIFKNGYVFVHNSKKAIENGSYFFANSHNPSHALDLPDKTFTITVLRSPVKRVLSFYRYMYFIQNDPTAQFNDPLWKEASHEAKRLLVGSSFHDFLDRLPRHDLTPQLYMFSSQYDVSEAIDKAISCSAVLFTENFNEDVINLGKRLKLPLKPSQERRFVPKVDLSLSSSEEERLQEMLEDEVAFYKKVRSVTS